MREHFVAPLRDASYERFIEMHVAIALERWAAAMQALCSILGPSYTLRTTRMVGGWHGEVQVL